MSNFIFDDFARTTLGGARNVADHSPLSVQQVESVIHYLKSAGSGPDSATSYADFLDRRMRALPPKLPAGVDYVGFSGTDRANLSNYANAVEYAGDLGGRAGIIGDTPWGAYVTDLEANPTRHPDFMVVEGKLQSFMDARGVEPLRGDYGAALRDIMWNAGSPQYFENAIATGKPILAFVENAPINRGFSNFELTTALQHPDARINGYPVSAFGPDPLTFVSNSAAEYQTLERAIAQQASTNSGHPVTVAQVRAHLKPIDGYDAADRTLFNRPLDDFKTLHFGEMTHARADWVASRNGVATGPRLYADLPEPMPQRHSQPGAPRGPPNAAATIAEVAADSAPHGAHAGISPSMKVAGVAGMALLAHDFATSGHKWVELNARGNVAGADSTAAHFVGRNVGGALGGFIGGAGVGLASGSWTGPGAIVVGIGGGVLGAHLGERWAEQKDIERIYTQVDPMGRTWTRDPADPEGRWLRGAHQQQVQSSNLGNGVEVRPVQTAQGDDVTFRASYVASGTLERQLNWQAANASYELGLANPPPPQDPYRLSASGEQSPPRAPFETERTFVRDPISRQWELEIEQLVDGRVPVTRHEAVSPERAQALDEQSRTVIAQNAANTPAAMAARYMVAYEQGRWSDFGDAENPSIPHAIQHAQASADTLQASDGNSYTREQDGRWISKGLVFDSTANRNVSEQLDVTWQSQQAGVAGLDSLAQEIRANVQVAPEGIRGQVAALYAHYGIERTEEQLAATAVAVEQSLASNGRQADLVLELIPDPRIRAPSAESVIAAFGDAGGNRMVLTATTTMEDVAKIQSLHQQSAAPSIARVDTDIPTLGTVAVTAPRPAQTEPDGVAHRVASAQQQAPIPDTPELRIDRLSPREQEAHQQALREANRQGASTAEAQQAATFAAMAAGGADVDEARAPQLPEDVVQAVPSQAFAAASATAAPAQIAAAAIAAAPVLPDHDTQPKQQTEAPRPPTQDAAAMAEQQRSREHTARNAEHADQLHREDNALHRQQQPAQQAADFVSVPERSERTMLPTTEAPERAYAAGQAQEVELLKSRIEAPARNENTEITRQLPTATSEASVEPETEGPRPHTAETAELQAARFNAEPSPTDAAEHERLAAPENDRPSEELANAQVAPTEVPPPQEALTETPAPPDEAVPWTPVNPHHPDHALYQQIRKEVTRLDESHGRTYDQTSERLTGSLLVLAKSNGLDRVDHVALSSPTAQQPGAHTVFVVQGDMGNPGHLRAGMLTEQAVKTPFEESLEQFDVVAHEQEQRNQQLNLQRQFEDDKVQHDMQIAAASVGG
ncbi:XVIPCD domain-containing protein [Stenotrophomonas sp. TWI700]|uniref:XVIPCD domain-containing protein n=1 Tax=Stenotrophomonas sp. TWI700 TaxID=3136792 RepID=UPI0032086D0C